jgi:hypothetical protein
VIDPDQVVPCPCLPSSAEIREEGLDNRNGNTYPATRGAENVIKRASRRHRGKSAMPSLTLESGVVFGYTDSGAVTGGGDYTTLVIIHGHTFHSGE